MPLGTRSFADTLDRVPGIYSPWITVLTCLISQNVAVSAMGADTLEQVSPKSKVLKGGSCICSKNCFMPTAMSHWVVEVKWGLEVECKLGVKLG